MPSPRPHYPRSTPRAAVLLATTALLSACTGDTPPARVDSATTATVAASDSAATSPNLGGWNPSAGPVFLAAGPAVDEAVVYFAVPSAAGATPQLDTGTVDQGVAVLFARDGARFTATLELPAGNDDANCRVWPLRNLRAAGAAGSWSVGFVSDNVVSLGLDSVSALSTRDSMALVAEASRLASTVSANTSAVFQGLRFTAHDIRRFEPVPGVQALAAHLTRRVNQEADPQEEQTLLIAERDSGATTGPYQLTYAERTHGREEDVSTSEVVAAVRVGSAGLPSLIVAREGNEGLAYSFLERSAPRSWQLRWTSGRARCAD